MKFKILLLSLLLVLVVSIVFSKEVDVQKAKTLAVNFYFEKSNQFSHPVEFNDLSIIDIVNKKAENTEVYYVFTFNTPGFVIVSADDALPPVLGYSLKSQFKNNNAPDSYKNFMQSYADAVVYVRENKIQQTDDIFQQWNYYLTGTPEIFKQTKGGKSVDPLVLCKWNQGFPYNVLCPVDPAGPGGHVYAGCVATAMAQVIYYWRHPLQGSGSHTYNYYPYGNLTANFGATTYEWAGMKNNIDHANANPIAELQYQCGVAVEMMYGPNGSGAYSWDVPYALSNYFGYSSDCYFSDKDSYSNAVWINMLKENIDNAWPMYYSGFSSAGGHAFVCDGYQDDYFHFNFGWGGSSDGFYTLLSVNGFNQGQGAVFDTYPAGNYPHYSTGDHVLTQISGSIEDGSGPIENYQDNTNCTWLIDPQTAEDSISSITIEFFMFETEANDFVKIYDGGSVQDNLLGEFSGSTIPDAITSSGNKMLIVFSSDNAGTAKGWYAEFDANKPDYCSEMITLTGQTGTFSDGSGNFNYQNSMVCKWKIEPEFAESVTLFFASFDTENETDKVRIYNTETLELLAEYSGSYAYPNLPEPVTSPSGKMFVAFLSGPSVTGAGWEANYTSTLTGVDNIGFSEDGFSIYPNPVSETLNITCPPLFTGQMEIKLFSLDGRIQYAQTINVVEQRQNYMVDVKDLYPGIYLLKLTRTNQTICIRILKN